MDEKQGKRVDTPPINLESVMEAAVRDKHESWPKNMRIWPSDLGVALGPEHDGCQREFWGKCRDLPRKELTVGSLLRFLIGDAIHEFVVEVLSDHLPSFGWRVIGYEERVEKFGISGRYDILIEHPESGVRLVIDVKTKRGGAFSYLDEAKPGDVLQVQQYIAATDAAGGILLYVDREGANFVREFKVERNDRRPEKAVETLTCIRDSDNLPPAVQLGISRRENKGPDSVYLKEPWQLSWCNLKECLCSKEFPRRVPDGIVAKLHTRDEETSEVRFTDAGEGWEDVILDLLRSEYPNEDFFTVGSGGD